MRYVFNQLFGKRNNDFIYDKVYQVNSFLDVPESLVDSIYLVKSGKTYKWAIFSCPNGCGKRIEVNLMKNHRPRWQLYFIKNKVSLSPSIYVKECGAHFWILKNVVKWTIYEK